MASKKMRDCFWIWGHPAGCHDQNWGIEPLHSRMTPCEGAYYLGARNCIMVCYGDEPKPPFDQEAMALDSLREVIWSVIGDYSSSNNAESFGHLDEVLRIAQKFPNIKGAIFDDFFIEDRLAEYTVDKVAEIHKRLSEAPSGKLDLWVVVYDYMQDIVTDDYLEHFDGITYWTWHGNDLEKFEENYSKMRAKCAGKRILLGCYLYDYGNKKQFTKEQMEFQLNRYAKAIRDGEVEGVILLSNTVADLGFEAVEFTKQWIAEHGDELV